MLSWFFIGLLIGGCAGALITLIAEEMKGY